MRRAALSIEGSHISIAVANVLPWGKYKVLTRSEAELPELAEERANAINELLHNLRDEHGVKEVVIGLEPHLFTHNFVDLPVSGKSDVGHALNFELEKYLPLPPDEYVLDFHSSRIAAGGSRNLIVSAIKDKLEWITSAIKEAGLDLAGIKCTAFEVLNNHVSTSSEGTHLFVYHGGLSAAAINIQSGEPVSLSFRPLGDNPEETVRGMTEGYDSEITVSGVEGSPTYTGENIKTIKLLPVDGLLASGNRGRFISMDFTPAEFLKKKRNLLPHAMAALTAACVVMFFLTSSLAYYKDYSALSSVRDRLDEIRSSSKELVEIKKETEAIQKRLSFLKKFEEDGKKHIFLIRRLSRILPKSAWLTSFSSTDGKTVEIEGFAKRTSDIIRKIEQSDEFKDVEFSTPITVRDGRERFALRAKVEQ